jgi:hypothetical protein
MCLLSSIARGPPVSVWPALQLPLSGELSLLGGLCSTAETCGFEWNLDDCCVETALIGRLLCREGRVKEGVREGGREKRREGVAYVYIVVRSPDSKQCTH